MLMFVDRGTDAVVVVAGAVIVRVVVFTTLTVFSFSF